MTLTPGDQVEPPVRVTVVRVDGELWWVCPVAGAGCCRVPAEIGDWAQDAIAWHVSNHHRQWR